MKTRSHFLIRQVRAHPHQVTIYAAGPLTNIALAIPSIPEFAALTKGIVLMGWKPESADRTIRSSTSPRHEFNFWFDPEAAHIVLRADWPRIDVTTVDVSIKAPFTQRCSKRFSKVADATARYIAAWSQDRYYLWDELAACAWLDPTLITKEKARLHGRGPEPRAELWRHADVERKSEAGDGSAAGARAGGFGFAALSEDVCGADDAVMIRWLSAFEVIS